MEEKPQPNPKNTTFVWKIDTSRIAEKRHKSANHASRRTTDYSNEFSSKIVDDSEEVKSSHEAGLAYLVEARRKLQLVNILYFLFLIDLIIVLKDG